MKEKSEINRLITRLELCKQDVLTILNEHESYITDEFDIAQIKLTKVVKDPEGINRLNESLAEYVKHLPDEPLLIMGLGYVNQKSLFLYKM